MVALDYSARPLTSVFSQSDPPPAFRIVCTYYNLSYHTNFPTHTNTETPASTLAFGEAARDACECVSGVLDSSGDLCGELLCCRVQGGPAT